MMRCLLSTSSEDGSDLLTTIFFFLLPFLFFLFLLTDVNTVFPNNPFLSPKYHQAFSLRFCNTGVTSALSHTAATLCALPSRGRCNRGERCCVVALVFLCNVLLNGSSLSIPAKRKYHSQLKLSPDSVKLNSKEKIVLGFLAPW